MSDSIITSMLLGVFGLLITIYYNRFNARLAHDKMSQELFKDFNKRYDKINDFLVEIESTCKTIHDLEANPPLKNKLNAFFNLCAEEYYWYKKDRIDKDIWQSWQAGMNDWYNRVPVIQEAWKKEMSGNGPIPYYIKRPNDFFIKA